MPQHAESRILIIHHHVHQPLSMRSWLQEAGYRVRTAEYGHQTLEIARREAPDLLLCDVTIPRLYGWDGLRDIRLITPLSPVPLLLFGEFFETSPDTDEALDAEADAILLEPFDARQLLEQISLLLSYRNAEERCQAVPAFADGNHHAIIGKTLDGKITSWNAGAERIYGYQAEEVIGQSINILAPHDRQHEFAQLLERIRHGSPIEQQQARLVAKDGRHLELALTMSPILDERGTIMGVATRAIEKTSRQQIEDALQQSEAHYRLLFEINPQPMWFYEAESLAFLAVNDAAINEYGYSREEFLAMTLKDIRPQEDVPQLVWASSESREGFKFSGEWRHLKKDGTLIDVAINSYSIRFAGQEARLAQVTDITERKKTERQLKQSEERFRALIENASDLIAVLGADGSIRYISPSLQNIFGYQPQEWLGKPIFEFIHPDDVASSIAALQAGLHHTDTGESLEVRVRHQNGDWRIVEARDTNLLDNEAVNGIVINARDITERKQAEALLRAADRRAIEAYESLLDRLSTLALNFGKAHDLLTIYRVLNEFVMSLTPSFGVVVCFYDEARKVRQGAYFNVNGIELPTDNMAPIPVRSGPASKAINVGRTLIFNDYLKDLEHRNPVHVGGEEDKDLPRSALIAPLINMNRTIGTIEVQSHQLAAYTHEHATAIQMAANLAANAIENVRLLHLEREKAEQLRQAQKMEAIGQLAGGVAHDFNNLLTAINGYSELGQQQLSASHPLYDHLSEIRKAGERAASLTRQLLAFSRKQVLQPEILDLNTIVVEMEKMLRRVIGEDIELETVLAPDIGKIKADPGQLEQVILNLVVNARDALPEGGRLTVSTENQFVDEAFASQYLGMSVGQFILLKVSDTGIGMSEETQAHIFEPFFTTKEAGKGTGLGLSTVYGIVQQSGGYITLNSRLGHGTTFSIWLPRLSDDAIEKASAKITTDSPQGKETVLLTEDEETVRNLVRRVLEMLGYCVLTSSNGEEALTASESHQGHIHLLLTDVIMPKMNGRELASRLMQQRPDTRVLYMSGYTSEHQHELTMEKNFIQKPFTPDFLAKKIREVLDDTA